MKFQPPRGMKDIDEEEMSRREYVYDKIRSTLKRYGFRFIEPSALENFETLAAKAGPGIENEIYSFKDKSDRKIALRFDLTVGTARMIASSARTKPIKVACISNMWRYDRPQYARYRSFWQWNVEIFGVSGVEADAEIISAACDIMAAFELDYEMRISNRKLVEGFLIDFGVKEKNLLGVMRVIDKISKISQKELIAELKKYGVKKDSAEKILGLCKKRGGAELLDKLEIPDNKLAKEGFSEIKELFKCLNAYGTHCILDLSIVRGIDYYTGIVYEVWVKDDSQKVHDETTNRRTKGASSERSSVSGGAVAGGGRYDNLMKIYGNDMPATGIAGGIERLLLSLEKKEIVKENIPKILVAYTNDALYEKAIAVLKKIRKSASADTDLLKRTLRKQMDYANAKKIPYVVIIGQQELEKNCVKLRMMQSGEEKEISLDDLESEIRKLKH
jgi:histidyl-tRNA synthetase